MRHHDHQHHGERRYRPEDGERGRRGPRGFGPEGFDPREGFGPRGPRGPHGHGRGRRPRGDVRTAVLLLLAEEPMHGYQLMQTITDRTSGRWTPSPGTIYPTLSQLEDEGLVETAKESGRKLATLTEAGAAHVAEHREGWSDPFASPDEDADQQIPDVRAAMHDLGGAVREAGRSANAEQLARVTALLTTTKREVYAILASTPEA
ncbi:PadR family transcriptional regulator [Brachybacterium sp. NBEC-018]|uniref:PadR family transcriptional regulator n=1 Tax=Brachybacterium sp. NBEC-018 TaxID=2996004 RepID=UPI00217569E1|nr:PadR family transcriptional regulator [Brachybacterium sp. NBEC-018]UVY84458.1 PadR family transcriptional regulator [Brachybacterium sp. NBEC-018]